MKALLALKSAINQASVFGLMGLVALIPAMYPKLVIGVSLQTNGIKPALVFEIKDPSKLFADADYSVEKQNYLTFKQITSSDPLTIRLEKYLEEHNSPLAEYASEMIQQPQWQRALAISWVESNFCLHHQDNNCSGIGVAPGHPSWRKYPTHLEWFKDMAKLMERPLYKDKLTTFEKMRGVYVYPGSNSWVYGAKTKYAQLMALTAEAENERIALANISQISNIQTFPQLALAK